MKCSTSMTDQQLAEAIAHRIVANICEAEANFAHGPGWTLEEWVVDTLLNGHQAKPLRQMTREELLVLWSEQKEEAHDPNAPRLIPEVRCG